MNSNNQFLTNLFFTPYFNPHFYFWPQSTQNYQFHVRGNNLNEHLLLQVPNNQGVEILKSEEISSSNEPNNKKQTLSKISEKQIESTKRGKKTLSNENTQRNQTKNISKNFGKAILSFAKTNSKFSKKLLKQNNVQKQTLINYIKKARKNLNSLRDLRQMWGAQDKEDKLKKCLRIISYHFMRKHCLGYIFNSRIKSVGAHTKYRHRLMEGISRPSEFRNIKLN